MKGKKKYIVPLLLAGITTTTGIVAHVQQQEVSVNATEVTAYNYMDGCSITLDHDNPFKDSYNLNVAADQKVYMPTVVTSGGEAVTYKVTRGSQEIELKTEGDRQYFIPRFTGAYNVTITAGADEHVPTVLDNLTVWVVKNEAVINLPTNSKYVIPAKVPAGQKDMKIPAPTISYEEDGEEVEETAAEAGDKLAVKLVKPNGTEVNLALTADATNGDYYAVNATSTDDNLKDAGTYEIRYVYSENGTVVKQLSSRFQVVKDYDTSDLSLYFKLASSVSSTGSVGTDVSVPKVSILADKDSTDTIEAYVTIQAVNIADRTIKYDVDMETYTFHPVVEGEYQLVYNASIDLFGISAEEYRPTDRIVISDRTDPVVRPTYEYALDDNGKIVTVNGDPVNQDDDVEDMLVNRKVDVPSVAVLNDQGKAIIKLPAIYGSDNATEYGNLKLTRRVVGTVTRTVEADAWEVSEDIILTESGSYEIRYIAEDESGRSTTARYNLVVYNKDEIKDGELTVDFNTGVSAVSDKETLKISKPKATDTYDTAVDVEAFFKIVVGDEEVGPEHKLTKTNSDGKYEVAIADILAERDDATALNFYTRAKVDSTLLGTRDAFATEADLTVVSEKQTVTIVNSTLDTEAATFAVVGGTWENAIFTKNASADNAAIEAGTAQNIAVKDYATGQAPETLGADGYAYHGGNRVKTESGVELALFDQGKESLWLPDVTFTDKLDNNLKIRVTVKDRLGNVVTKSAVEKITMEKVGSDYVYTVSGAKFRLSASGVYTVTYRAEDVAGNVTVQTYGIRVNDRTAPTIVINDEDKFGQEIEVGEVFNVPAGKVYKNGVDQNKTVSWDIYKTSDGAEFEKQETGFTPLTAGTFFIRYYGFDDYGQMAVYEDSVLYLTAKDTKAPIFNEESRYVIPASLPWAKDDENKAVASMNIDIPLVYATDQINNKAVDVTYTVTAPNGSKIKVQDYNLSEEGNEDKYDVKYFKATEQGEYTIRLEATDEAGNTVSKDMTIRLGDCDKPELTFVSGYSVPTTVEKGEFELKLSKLEFSDNETSVEKLQQSLTVTMVKPDGVTTVKNKGTDSVNYKWDLDETGDYTLTLTIKDDAGNTTTKKYTINIPSEENETKKVGSVVGTILVVASVVVLAGVVIYFVLSSRKKSAKGAKKSTK